MKGDTPKYGNRLQRGLSLGFWRQIWRQKTVPDMAPSNQY